MTVIIDYGLGNLGSIQNMFRKIGAEAEISSDPAVISQADRLLLPGVGAFDNGMTNLRERGFIELLNQKVQQDRTPILGICLGMQLLTRRSEEGTLQGLSWVEADTRKFDFSTQEKRLTIPHMGWEYVHPVKSSKLWHEMPEESKFYFVHSYYVACDNADDVLLTTEYGGNYHSGLEKDNIIGLQFHPEKSHKYGMQVFRNFVTNY